MLAMPLGQATQLGHPLQTKMYGFGLTDADQA